MEKSEVKRLPRYEGLTLAMQEYHKSNNPSILEGIQTKLIQIWIVSNGVLMGTFYTYIELANFLEVNPEVVRNKMKTSMLDSKLFSPETQADIINSLIGQQITWILEDKMSIDNQVQILRKAQGNDYRPYVTSELNKALSLKNGISLSLTSLIKQLTQKDSNIIINQNNVVQQVTIDDVLNIVQQENDKLLKESNKDTEIKYIEDRYHIDELPEVNATKQKIGNKENERIPLPEVSLLDSLEDPHEIRREKMLNIDTNSEDPETIIY